MIISEIDFAVISVFSPFSFAGADGMLHPETEN